MYQSLLLILAICILTACGYKGNLYLPHPNDKNQFGIIQTDIEFKRSQPRTASEPISTNLETTYD